jgi:ribonuclease P protein component
MTVGVDSYCFRRSQRLLKAAEFTRVFDHQPFKSTDRFWTVLALSNDVGRARLGLVITKKRARHAVIRNRLKRLIRESFRHNCHIFQGVDILVMARSDAIVADNQTLRQSLERRWQHLLKRFSTN